MKVSKRNKVCACTVVFSNEFVLRAMNHFHNKYVAFLSSLDKEKIENYLYIKSIK